MGQEEGGGQGTAEGWTRGSRSRSRAALEDPQITMLAKLNLPAATAATGAPAAARVIVSACTLTTFLGLRVLLLHRPSVEPHLKKKAFVKFI